MNKYSNSNKTELKILINIIGQCIAEVHMETLPYAYLVKDYFSFFFIKDTMKAYFW